MRKRVSSEDIPHGAIDLKSVAAVAYSSEDEAHPVEHLFDGTLGPGATYWASLRADTAERIVLEFDRPLNISRLVYEVEERQRERTQSVRVEFSTDRGVSYRSALMQDYTFSPRGSTFQHEDVRIDLADVTNLRLTIVPNKGGSGRATLTSLNVFE